MASGLSKDVHGAVLLSDGSVAIAQAVLPVWARQLDVILGTLNSGIAELSQAVIAIDSLQSELAGALAAQPSDNASLSKQLEALSPALQHQVEQALAGLQIGDRLSQMLTVVQADMHRLIDHMPLEGADGLREAEHWLDDLRARYTTPEQHAAHADGPAPPPAAGIDYF